MKKVVALFVSLVLLVSAVAFADPIPSKTTEDMTVVVVVAEDGSVVSGRVREEKSEFATAELSNLAKAESVSKYFGDIVDANGNPVKLVDLLGATEEELKVHEFFGLTAIDFTEGCGSVVCTMDLATPYEVGSKVVVLIGLSAKNNVVWTALQGEVVESIVPDTGCVMVTIPEELLLKIQNGNAIVAIVNK